MSLQNNSGNDSYIVEKNGKFLCYDEYFDYLFTKPTRQAARDAISKHLESLYQKEVSHDY